MGLRVGQEQRILKENETLRRKSRIRGHPERKEQGILGGKSKGSWEGGAENAGS